MKKFLALMLTMAMSFCLVACGGDEEPAQEQQQQPAQQQQQQEQEVAQEGEAATTVEGALWEYANVPAPSNIAGTTWNLSGGCFSGVEMTQKDLDDVLVQYGGKLAFQFAKDGKAKLIQGGGELEGTWEFADEDGYVVALYFDYNGQDLTYACVFTDMSMNGGIMMIAITDENGQEGLYFDIDEH